MPGDGLIAVRSKELDKLGELLRKQTPEAEDIVARVLQTARNHVRTQLPKLLPEVFGITSENVKKSLNRRRVKIVRNLNRQRVEIEVAGRPLTATSFPHKPETPPTGNRLRSAVEIYRSKGMIPLTGKKGKGVFLARAGTNGVENPPFLLFHRTGEYTKGPLKRRASFMASGKQIRFRTSKPREKIDAVRTLSIPQMILTEAVSRPLLESLEKSLDRKIKKELSQLLAK